jgi:general L-amino acid transport system permease protein
VSVIQPAAARISPLAWARANLFNSVGNSIITVVVVAALAMLVPKLLNWAYFNAVFEIDAQKCRVATGACWGFIAEKYRLIFFGTYPFEEQWRPLAMSVILLALVGLTMNTRLWGTWLWISWLVGIVAMWVLMAGGLFGLPVVETERWGGLPLTLILAVNSIVFSFPLAVLLALGRRSDLPLIKTICIGFIEIVRGVPLVTVLFMASLMLPLFLPEGMTIDKLLRAQVGLIFFTAAYVAEVIRGGLQAIPKGQYEAADALGLSYWQKTGFIILPQALKLVIPPTVNTFIGVFKDTSLVIIVGIFDFLGSVRIASNDPVWRPFYIEGLVVAGLIYFVFCYTMASYSRNLENRLNRQQQR